MKQDRLYSEGFVAEIGRLSRELTAAKSALKIAEQALEPFAAMADDMEDALDLIDDPDRREDVEIIFGGMLVSQSDISEFNRARTALAQLRSPFPSTGSVMPSGGE